MDTTMVMMVSVPDAHCWMDGAIPVNGAPKRWNAIQRRTKRAEAVVQSSTWLPGAT